MGAYYEATIGETRYDTHALDNGLKLMEHSYVENNYCMAIEYMLLDNPQSLVWLCDYHEADDKVSLTWDNTNEEAPKAAPDDFGKENYYIINHDYDVYYDRNKLLELYKETNGEDSWAINPLPLLCNSDSDAQGGGDFHSSDIRRGIWAGDSIEIKMDRPLNMDDITDKVVFVEER